MYHLPDNLVLLLLLLPALARLWKWWKNRD